MNTQNVLTISSNCHYVYIFYLSKFHLFVDIALYDRDGNDFDANVQVPRVYCTIQDCLSDTNMYQTLSATRTKTTPSEENFNTYDVIPNHSKGNASGIRESKPFVPPKPQKKTEIKQTTKWSVTCFKTPPLRRSK